MPSRPRSLTPRVSRTDRRFDAERGSSRERGYTAAWDKAAKAYRRENPLCQYGEAGAFGRPHVAAATRVDHLYPQRRFEGVFWSQGWWVATCDACDAAKQALEHGPKAALDRLARHLGRPVLDEAGGG